MKISLANKKELLECLNKVHSVVEKKNTLQILSNLYFQVQGETLTIKATDLEVSMETSLPVKTLEQGKATVSAKNFLEIIRELPDREIVIHSKENHWVGISCGKSAFNIMGLAPEDFPSLPAYSSSRATKADVDTLKKMVDHTLYAVSTDETRYQLNGVLLEQLETGECRMVATDGHRLALFEGNLFPENKNFLPKSIIIPRKGIQEIRKIMDSSPKTVELSLEGNHLLVRGTNTFISVRLIEGQYVDYKQVIPKLNTKQLEIDRVNFSDSLRRVSLLANEKSRGIKLTINPGKLEISSNNPDIGEATEVIETSYSGEAMEIGFNAKYLQDTLSVIEQSSVHFELNDRMSPGVLKVPGTNEYISVLMPMRL